MRVRVAGLIVIGLSVLLVKHSKHGIAYWLLPGGGIKVGEDIRIALKRELKEELNLDVSEKELLFVVETWSDEGIHIIQPTFSLKVNNFDRMKVGVDSRIVGFDLFNKNEIKNITVYPDIKDELTQYLEDKKIKGKYIFKKWIE